MQKYRKVCQSAYKLINTIFDWTVITLLFLIILPLLSFISQMQINYDSVLNLISLLVQ